MAGNARAATPRDAAAQRERRKRTGIFTVIAGTGMGRRGKIRARPAAGGLPGSVPQSRTPPRPHLGPWLASRPRGGARARCKTMATVKLLLAGDVMTGRGIDQV